MSKLILPDDPADGLTPWTAEQAQARADGLTPCCFTVYLQNPAMAAAVQLEAEQAANLLNTLPATLPQTAQDAPGGDSDSNPYPGRAHHD